MSSIDLAYTDSLSNNYSASFSLFSGAELARTYDATNNFQRSASGAQIITGRPGRQKYIWAVACILSEADALNLDNIFQAWDVDRADGLPAVVTITDSTGFRTETGNAIFSTPPSFTRFGPANYQVSFGLTEV
jgi:hypothetical protein|tara:strand:- start:4150 stop:4548 length:399 start_codon:yes stop_codon:yes gene_type:complete